jgi:hypothetical protein
VAASFDNGALLARSYALVRGPRVRLRLAQVRDAGAIAALLERCGQDPEALAVARLTRFDPRRRVVICASALIGSSETVVGVGAIELGAREPELLMVDDELTEGLDVLLRPALIGRSSAAADRHAA